jgi:hypothetical protein
MTALQIISPGAPGGVFTVDALPCGVPGLMIHAATGAGGWVITHARSGYAVAWFPEADPESVLGAAPAIGPLADWTASGSDVARVDTAGEIAAICQARGAVPYCKAVADVGPDGLETPPGGGQP